MKLIVHAGTHKTGTTTFQNLCYKNYDILVANKVHYPKYKKWINHSYLAWYFQSNDTKEINSFFSAAFNGGNKFNCTTTLICGEDFENCIVDHNLANSVETAAKSVGYDEIEWLVVRRASDKYLRSIYGELCKQNGIVLDVEVLANLILKYGYFTCGTSKYNYKFVFDIIKFTESFKKHVNENISVIDMSDFTNDYMGNSLLKIYLDENSQEIFRKSSSSLPIKNKGLSLEIVETLYSLNCLGIPHSQYFKKELPVKITNLVNTLAEFRVLRSKNILDEFSKRYSHVFEEIT